MRARPSTRRFVPAIVLLAGVAAASGVGACARGRPLRPVADAAPPVFVPAPSPCHAIESGAALQPLLDSARPGDALCLTPGRYAGPIRIPAGVTVWGPREAVITSGGSGTTVQLLGVGPALLGVTVDGSGGRFDTLDAAVYARGEGARIEGVKVMNAMFGILIERSRRAVVRGNVVLGDAQTALGLRGDGIRLWETDDSRVEDNRVEDARDLVVWYSRRNTVSGNLVRRGRYGTHFMYSHDNAVTGNRYLGNEVGVFVMYSRGLRIERNLMADGTGAAGMGLGLKESGDLVVRENMILHDTIGLYLDSSPLQHDEQNLFERNVIRLCEQGVVFHSSERRNTFRGNSFRDNATQVTVEGGGHALDVAWSGNDFDDYAGYDLDGDGVGDAPYELRSLSSDLLDRYPDLAFFRGSAALAMVRAAGEIVPLLAPRTVLRDPGPRMYPLELGDTWEARGAD